jgi:hypothetical protein
MGKGPQWSDDQIEEMLKRMRDGETLTSISSDARMPSIDTMNRWEGERETPLGAAITRARELGYTTRAEKALAEAKSAEDAQLGRLAFDAERWFLGKMHPKKFGDSALLKHADADGNKLDLAAAIHAGNARLDGSE